MEPPSQRLSPLWWIGAGDVNALLSLVLDNLTQLLMLSVLLIHVFDFPREIVFGRMIPGTAVGILAGNAAYTYMAVRLGRRLGRTDVTAMPLGIDSVSLFGYTLGIMVPVWLSTGDGEFTWRVGMATIVLSGLIKLLLTLPAKWIKETFPPTALLGSIAGVALMLIAFLPMLSIMNSPLVGFVSMGIIFVTFFTRRTTIWGVPGALWAVVAGTAVYYGLGLFDQTMTPSHISGAASLQLSLPGPTTSSLAAFKVASSYISIIIPLSIANVVGGVDVTESAEAAGDPYDVRAIVFVESVTTVAGALFGGVVQTTPYIGHPAYKKMGGRAGYTLFTGLVVGAGGMAGLLSPLLLYLPKEAIVPILLFIGLEITAQAFRRSPSAHAPAVALCFVPSIAYLVQVMMGQFGLELKSIPPEARPVAEAVRLLANGFIVTALVWGGALASVIDEQHRRAALFLGLGVVFSLFGLIHSPLEHGALFLPWRLSSPIPWSMAAAYLLPALLLYGSSLVRSRHS